MIIGFLKIICLLGFYIFYGCDILIIDSGSNNRFFMDFLLIINLQKIIESYYRFSKYSKKIIGIWFTESLDEFY